MVDVSTITLLSIALGFVASVITIGTWLWRILRELRPDNEAHFVRHLLVEETDKTGAVTYEEAKIYMNARRYKNALNLFSRALPHAKRNTAKLAIRCGLGFVHYKIGDFPRALKEFRRSIALAESTGNLPIKAWIFHRIGIICKSTGRTDDALNYLEKSLAILEKVGTRHQRIDVQADMAMCHLYRRDYVLAAKLNSRSFAYHLLLGLGDGIAPGMTNGAVQLIHLRKYRIALLILRASAFVSMKQGDQRALATTLHSIGNCYSNLGEPDLAEDSYRESMTISKKYQFSDIESATNFSLASLNLKRGELEEAFVLAQMSELISHRIGSKELEAKSLGILGEVFRRRGDPNKAIVHHKKGLTIAMSVGNIDSIANLLLAIRLDMQAAGRIEELAPLVNGVQVTFPLVESRLPKEMI